MDAEHADNTAAPPSEADAPSPPAEALEQPAGSDTAPDAATDELDGVDPNDLQTVQIFELFLANLRTMVAAAGD